MIVANLSVRKLEEDVYQQLRIRAARHGVSMEEEARQIISQAVKSPERMSDVFLKYFGDKNGVDLNITKRKAHPPLDFEQ